MKRRICITSTGLHKKPLLISRDPAGDYIEIEGEFDYEIEDLEQFVQVRYLNASDPALSARYTYRDPGFDLEPGDIVSVPVWNKTTFRRAIVAQKGRGKFRGEVYPVNAVLLRNQ